MRKFILPGVYLGLAIYVWVDFLQLPTDGLANVGLMLITFPVALAGVALTEIAGGERFVLLPDGYGYYGNHALYYWPSVTVITVVLYWAPAAFRRRRGRD